jgi:molybdopterin converting factor small subunit
MAVLLIPPILRPLTDGKEHLTVPGTTVEAALAALQEQFPEAGARVRQAIARRYVILSVAGIDIRDQAGGDTAVGPAQEIHLLWAVAGG